MFFFKYKVTNSVKIFLKEKALYQIPCYTMVFNYFKCFDNYNSGLTDVCFLGHPTDF